MKSLQHIALDLCLAARKARGITSLKPLKEFTPDQISNVLVISCTAMGDTLFATPAIRALSKLLPHANIDLLARDRFAPLFNNLPHITNILKYRGRCRGALNLVSQLRKHRYDLCISLHDSDPCPIKAAFLAGIPFIFRIGLKDHRTVPFLSARVKHRPEKHAIEQRFDVLRMLFGPDVEKVLHPQMILPVSEYETNSFWQHVLKGTAQAQQDMIKTGFQFSASGLYKMWPLENWIRLGLRVLEWSDKMILVLFGGPSDREEAEKLAEGIIAKNPQLSPKIVNLAGNMKLTQLPAALRGLDVFVTNDTGPLHAAVAVRTPTVSLFVPTRSECTAPMQNIELHTVLKKERPCTPCTEKYCKDAHCMSLITVDEVFRAVKKSIRARQKC